MARTKTICILGRQPALGTAELERLLGPETIRPYGRHTVLIAGKLKPAVLNRLGGSIKLGMVLAELPTNKWRDVESYLISAAHTYEAMLPPGKLHAGISAYGFAVTGFQVQKTALLLKKSIKQTGRNVRIVPNKEAALSSAQVIHNKLTGKNAWELVVVTDGNSTVLAQTAAVQDIDSYTARDQKRPYRDAKVGMLPPKLAQIIINLAHPGDAGAVVDPFCGTGVVLQEALLMGYSAIGSDIDNRMVDYSRKNINWLAKQHALDTVRYSLEHADATQIQLKQLKDDSVIACETYLGKPLSTVPDGALLAKIVQECDSLHKKFLQNIASQINPGFRLSLAVPAWKTKNGFLHLPVLDHCKELGYNRLSFTHVRIEDLLYHRPGQVVARELVVLEKNHKDSIT